MLSLENIRYFEGSEEWYTIIHDLLAGYKFDRSLDLVMEECEPWQSFAISRNQHQNELTSGILTRLDVLTRHLMHGMEFTVNGGELSANGGNRLAVCQH